MQALSFVAHIPLVCFAIAFPAMVAALLGFVALAFPTALPPEIRSGKTASRRID